MTIIRDLIDIEKIWSKSKKTPCDIAEFLEDDYYSASKKKPIKNGDMHLTHYVRRQLRDEKRDDETITRISKENTQLKAQLRHIKKTFSSLWPIGYSK
tara:strand:+ start:49 stop:342 length:294 start_codon:yes stop_codon:yes gene_type:complete